MWKRWNGGSCPVKGGTKIEAKSRDGGIKTIDNPEDYWWGRDKGDHNDYDIIAYRIIKDTSHA